MDINTIIDHLKKDRDAKILGGMFLLLTFGFFVSCQSKPKVTPIEAIKEQIQIDTLIPDGYSLIPIDVVNYEILDSILGSHGVVDIYSSPEDESQPSKRIASRVKITRAPKNPSHFAVLIASEKSKVFFTNPGPYIVSIRNPKSSGTVFEKKAPRKRSRVIYY